MILAIDPGADYGAALFDESSRLLCWAAFRALPSAEVSHLYMEDQEIRRGGKARTKDIIRLAQTAGRLAEKVRAPKETWVHYSKWAGSQPPHALEARILGCLSSEERATLKAALKNVAMSYRHNVVEAIGIGLYATRRLPR